MAEPSPVNDDEQGRQRLLRDVWGDNAELQPRRSRPPQRGSDLPVPDLLPQANGRIDDIERQVRQLQDDVASLRRMTDEGLQEIRHTMLRLAEAVQAITGPSGPRRKA